MFSRSIGKIPSSVTSVYERKKKYWNEPLSCFVTFPMRCSYLIHSDICRNQAAILGPVITGAPEVNYSYLCLVPPIWTTQIEGWASTVAPDGSFALSLSLLFSRLLSTRALKDTGARILSRPGIRAGSQEAGTCISGRALSWFNVHDVKPVKITAHYIANTSSDALETPFDCFSSFSGCPQCLLCLPSFFKALGMTSPSRANYPPGGSSFKIQKEREFCPPKKKQKNNMASPACWPFLHHCSLPVVKANDSSQTLGKTRTGIMRESLIPAGSLESDM